MKKFDFTNDAIAQDMISLIMEEKKISKEDAVLFAITKDIAKEILDAGWASIALPLWGHDDPERNFNSLEDPVISVELSQEQKDLLSLVSHAENVTQKEAIEFFLIFTMQELGYHI